MWVLVRMYQMGFHCFLDSMNLRFLNTVLCIDINLNGFVAFSMLSEKMYDYVSKSANEFYSRCLLDQLL